MSTSFPVVSYDTLRNALRSHEIVRASALARLADTQSGLTEDEARELASYRERVLEAQARHEAKPVPLCQAPRSIASTEDIDIVQSLCEDSGDYSILNLQERDAIHNVLSELLELRAHVRSQR